MTKFIIFLMVGYYCYTFSERCEPCICYQPFKIVVCQGKGVMEFPVLPKEVRKKSNFNFNLMYHFIFI